MKHDTGSGIDYGMGLTNVDLKNGIRYGVISQNEVLQVWADSSEPYYGEEEGELEESGDCVEALSYEYNGEGYKASCGDDGDIFILLSPYYTTCAFCSPCAPGAGYIMDTRKEGIRAYCFGHDWFEEGKAPYPVYDAKTDKLVVA
jgi:hypothetical protein